MVSASGGMVFMALMRNFQCQYIFYVVGDVWVAPNHPLAPRRERGQIRRSSQQFQIPSGARRSILCSSGSSTST